MIPRSRAALTLVAVLALLAPGRLAATPADDEPAAVSEVRIHGNQRIESAVIRSAVRTLAGEPLDRARLRDDVKSVWNLKYFQDVEVQVDASPEGPVVTFVVAEKPLVRKIEITGASEIEDEDLRKEVEVKPYNMLDRQAMRRSEKKLQSKYADKGFYLAEINARTAPASGPNEVDVVFDVNEHAKVEVRRISFQGNQALSDDELRAVMGTREQSLLSFLTSEGTYKEETFQRDLLVLQSLYYSKGYINVRIGRPAVTMTPDRRAILVNIPVEEGEPYDYGEIGVGGDLLGDRDKVQPLVTLKKGARFSSQDLQKVMLAVQDHFRDLGYAYAQVSPRTAVDPQARTVDIDFVVTPGAKVTVERIEVIGNTKTRDKVIRRELRVSEGDYYSGTAVRTSKGRVTALGFFESVDITSRQGSAADTMILEVAVKERATGTFQVGLGFSNSEGLLLNGNINQNNLFGWGTSGAFMVQWSKLRRIFDLSYSDPYFLDTKWTAAFDIFNTLQIYGLLFDRTATGGTITGGYELFEDFRMFVTYTLQKVGVEPGSASSVVLANRFRGGLTSSVKTSFNYDRRDNRLFPTAGYLLSASAEFAQPFFFSQNVFQRYIGIARYYRPLPWGLVFKTNLTAGYIASPRDNPVPLSELFFEGGINSLRGYDFRTVAPQVRAGNLPGQPLSPVTVGGNKELLSNWELEFPLLDEAGLRGVVFFDAGNVWGENQSWLDTGAGGRFGLLMSVGVGARWFTPLGPLRFEWGYELTPRPGDPGSRFEFTIGNFF